MYFDSGARQDQECEAKQNEVKPVSEFSVAALLKTPTVTIRDVYCPGHLRSRQIAEECVTATQLVRYRGVHARHLRNDRTVVEGQPTAGFRPPKAPGSASPWRVVVSGDGFSLED